MRLSARGSAKGRIRGFTLVELMVVISVMAIVGVMAFANYNSLGQDQNLKLAASDVQSILRLAQANATSRIKCNNDTSGSGANWIVSFETNKTTINLLCQIGAGPQVASASPLLLKNNIKIDSINGCSQTNPVTVTYQPLLGGVLFDDTPWNLTCVNNSQSINVTLRDPSKPTCVVDPNSCKTITINKGGSVGVQ